MNPRLHRAMKRLQGIWMAQNPRAFTRLERALDLVDGIQDHGNGSYTVRGSQGYTYVVWVDPRARTSTCTCPDSQKGNKCKHRWACALLYAAQRTTR